MGIILVVYYPIYYVLKATYQTPSFQMEGNGANLLI